MIDRLNFKQGILENVKKSLKSNSQALENLSNISSIYNMQRKKLIEICKKQNIRIVDAF